MGERNESDDWKATGAHSFGIENSRGQWLKQWCSIQSFAISNTFFPKRPDTRATFVGPNGRPRQIDYIL
eukprot:7571446-Karenia_brevis.AAC.1